MHFSYQSKSFIQLCLEMLWLQVLTSLENILTNELYESLETSEKNFAPIVNCEARSTFSAFNGAGMEPMLTGVEVKGKISTGESKDNVAQIQPQTQLQYHGTAVFKEDKLVGWLNVPESKGVHYAQNRVKSTVVVVTCENCEKVGIELIDTD